MATRNVRPFVHLRVLSWYSLGLAYSSPGEICRHARRIGFDTVAITDVSGTYGFVEFHRAAREVGVKPIYGVLLYLDWNNPPSTADPVHSVVLLALDRTGLGNVCGAATRSATRRERGDGFFAADLEPFRGGVIAVADIESPAPGVTPSHLLLPLRDLFSDRLFMACRAGLAAPGAELQAAVLAEARRIDISPVLVQDIRFVGPPRPQLIDLDAGLEDGAFEHRVFSDPRAGGAEPWQAMRTAAEMSEAFDLLPEAHANAALIASLVQPDLFDTLEVSLQPGVPAPLEPARDADAALRARVDAALARLPPSRGATIADEYRRIVNPELEMIERAGAAESFLYFEALTRRLRDAGVTVGPATGLALQSRCAFLLGITVFDPYALDERFRPEIECAGHATCVLDLQVAPEQRPRVLAALNQAFDAASIGYVPSVEHVTAARALRIAARRLDVDPAEYEDAVRIASRHRGASLRELSEENRAIGALYRRSMRFRELVSHAAAIEGLPFGFSRTKRTVIVSPRRLRTMFGYTVDPATGDHFVQATRDSFPFGAIRRIDITLLHVLAWIRGADDAWSTDGSQGYECIDTGDLDGVPLLEAAPGRLAPAFGVRNFGDLVYFMAMLRWREGGMYLPERLKSFRDEHPAVPAVDLVGEVLEETNGWVVFQDQVRDVIARLTGMTALDAADLVGRFRDHSPGNLAALRREFLARTVETPVPLDDATAWFTRLLRLSRRAVDRQSVIAESLVVHRCLQLKATDRAAFFAALLNHTRDEKKRERYQAVLEREGRWRAPSVNHSGRGYRVEDGSVRAPLWSVKGITRDAADAVIRMRGKTRYATLDEFSCAAAEAGISFDVVEALVRVGAVGVAVDAGRRAAEPAPRKRPRSGAGEQVGMDLGSARTVDSPPSYTPPTRAETIIDGNTQPAFRVVPKVMEFYPHPSATPVELAGRIRNLREFKSSSGKTIGFFELFDSSGSVRVFVPWERVAQTSEPLSDGCRVVVKGKVRLRDRRKVCDALEIVVAQGGNSNGEASPDGPAEGDS